MTPKRDRVEPGEGLVVQDEHAGRARSRAPAPRAAPCRRRARRACSCAAPRRPTACSFISTRSRIRSSGSSVCSRSGKATFSNTDHVGEQRAELEQHAHPAAHARKARRASSVLDRLAADARGLAGLRRAAAADQAQQRGLAAARLPHDADDLAARRSPGRCRAAPGAPGRSRSDSSGFRRWGTLAARGVILSRMGEDAAVSMTARGGAHRRAAQALRQAARARRRRPRASPPGEAFGLVGANGAGKTTLISACSIFRARVRRASSIFGVPARDPAARRASPICPSASCRRTT